MTDDYRPPPGRHTFGARFIFDRKSDPVPADPDAFAIEISELGKANAIAAWGLIDVSPVTITHTDDGFTFTLDATVPDPKDTP